MTAFAFFLVGCTTVRIPKYVTDKSPYKRVFVASYENTLDVTKQTLENLGWKVTDAANPSLYEQNRVSDASKKQILLFTQIRQTAMFLFTRYSTLNVYLRDIQGTSEVEIRYLVMTPFLFKTFEGHKNDRLVNQIFSRIAKGLEK